MRPTNVWRLVLPIRQLVAQFTGKRLPAAFGNRVSDTEFPGDLPKLSARGIFLGQQTVRVLQFAENLCEGIVPLLGDGCSHRVIPTILSPFRKCLSL